jgi:CBS domain-containing protein
MAQSIREVMQSSPVCLAATTTAAAAAAAMRDGGIGDVIVERDGEVCGIVTDRDIVVRVVAENRSPDEVRLGDICSRELTTLAVTDTVDEAVRLMATVPIRPRPPGLRPDPEHLPDPTVPEPAVEPEAPPGYPTRTGASTGLKRRQSSLFDSGHRRR